MIRRSQSLDAEQVLRTSGGLPVAIRRSPRARRMRLTVDAHGNAVVVLPRRASMAQARAFVLEQSAWLERHASRGVAAGEAMQEQVQPDAQGRPTRIMLRGEWTDLVWGRHGAWRLPERGGASHLEQRLRELARADAQQVIDRQLPLLARPPTSLTIRDQSTRWGSLSGRGTLSLSWRLVMAPPSVLAYVVNHELAHLRHPNHSPAFWAEVERLMPGHAIHRHWLRRQGDELRRLLPSA